MQIVDALRIENVIRHANRHRIVVADGQESKSVVAINIGRRGTERHATEIHGSAGNSVIVFINYPTDDCRIGDDGGERIAITAAVGFLKGVCRRRETCRTGTARYESVARVIQRKAVSSVKEISAKIG